MPVLKIEEFIVTFGFHFQRAQLKNANREACKRFKAMVLVY
jgi:hypothetical protein